MNLLRQLSSFLFILSSLLQNIERQWRKISQSLNLKLVQRIISSELLLYRSQLWDSFFIVKRFSARNWNKYLLLRDWIMASLRSSLSLLNATMINFMGKENSKAFKLRKRLQSGKTISNNLWELSLCHPQHKAIYTFKLKDSLEKFHAVEIGSELRVTEA